MRQRLLAIWAATYNLAMTIADRFRPLVGVGLNTEDDVASFVADMRQPVRDEAGPRTIAHRAQEPSPIFDVLTQEWPALYARRMRVLRWPTAEIDVRFRDLTSMLELDWLCQACMAGDHVECPSCSCSCSLAEVAA